VLDGFRITRLRARAHRLREGRLNAAPSTFPAPERALSIVESDGWQGFAPDWRNHTELMQGPGRLANDPNALVHA